VRYDPAFPLAQDFDLWVKLLSRGSAENVHEPLALYRVHPRQATQRFDPKRRIEQEEIGRRAIEAFGGDRRPAQRATELAWRMGAAAEISSDQLDEAVAAYIKLFGRFASEYRGSGGFREARRIAATVLLRRAGRGLCADAHKLRSEAIRMDPSVAAGAGIVRLSNGVAMRRFKRPAKSVLAALDQSSTALGRDA
jgi:hypothetical protein